MREREIKKKKKEKRKKIQSVAGSNSNWNGILSTILKPSFYLWNVTKNFDDLYYYNILSCPKKEKRLKALTIREGKCYIK